jgi:peptidoglycan/LPS O-acetylase OafA/YrhL
MLSKNLVTERTYLPQLDSLRVFAILGVLVLHFMNPRVFPGFSDIWTGVIWVYGSFSYSVDF